MKKFALIGPAIFLFNALPAAADPKNEPGKSLPSDLLECRSIADASARLVCYDSKLDLYRAERKADGPAGHEASARNEREAFGSKRTRETTEAIPQAKLTVGSRDIGEIEVKLVSISQSADGKSVLVFDDGSVWKQLDNKPLVPRPRPGNAVTVKRASLGSFIAQIGRGAGVRVRRLR